jgi:hypothetical protein
MICKGITIAEVVAMPEEAALAAPETKVEVPTTIPTLVISSPEGAESNGPELSKTVEESSSQPQASNAKENHEEDEAEKAVEEENKALAASESIAEITVETTVPVASDSDMAAGSSL